MNWKWKYLIQQQHEPKNLVSVKRSVTNVLMLILTWWYAPSTDAILVDSGNSKSVPISRMQVFLDFDLSHVLILTTGPLYDGKRFWVVCRKKIETKIITYFNVLPKKMKTQFESVAYFGKWVSSLVRILSLFLQWSGRPDCHVQLPGRRPVGWSCGSLTRPPPLHRRALRGVLR